MKHRILLQTLAISLAALNLVACGGSGGGSSSSGEESVVESPSASPLPIAKVRTLAGDSFTASGSVNVLAPGDGDDDGGGDGDESSNGNSYKPELVAVTSTDGDDFDLSFEDLSGHTLYVFDNDTPGASSCISTLCLSTWPPLIADDNADPQAPFTLIERDDGLAQWALRDKPLYFFAGDTAPGDVNGEGVGGTWHVAVAAPVLFNNNLVSGNSAGKFFTAYGRSLVSGAADSSNSEFNTSLQNLHGFSLYTFALDTEGVSNCTGSCLANWPALLAEEGDAAEAPFSVIERAMDESGGTALQWAYQGQPLYFFAGDSAAGDVNGDVISNWQLARPEPWIIDDSTRGSVLFAAGVVSVAEPEGEAEEVDLQTRDGFALYTFDNDESGVSNCSGSCLSNWPALMAEEGAVARSPYSLVERDSGLQWALEGKPLYFYVGDIQAGDINGDEVGGVWHLARSLPVVVDSHPDEAEIFIAKGKLIDRDGVQDLNFEDFTLYIFTDDTEGVSTCFDSCEDTWPPLFASEDAQDFGDFTVIDRNDPSTSDDDSLNLKQWAYQGQPLYFFIRDSSPGDVNGEYGTWFIARP